MIKQYSLFILAFILLFSFSKKVSATHVMGGEITWECLNNGQYVFKLKVYRDCNGVSFEVTNHALEAHNYPNTGVITQIPLNFSSVTDITPSCEGSACATLTQADPDIPGAIEEYILVSNPITLNGVPGANGWTFTWTYGNRNAAIDNIVNAQNFGITLRAKMFAYNNQNANACFDSSPDFFQKPSTIICSGEKFTYNHSAFDRELDSLHYSWARPLDGVFCNNRPCLIGGLFQEGVTPQRVQFDGANNYRFDSPYPDSTLDSRNEAAVLDPITGEITFTSFNTGEFVSIIRVEAFKCGQKVAEVYRELQTVISAGCASNEPPIIPPPINGSYSDTVRAGEFVNFDISIFDTLRLDNPKDDSIFFFASGLQFGTNFSDSLNGCLNPPCATLSYPAPDTGIGSYQTTFGWQTSCDHIANTTPTCISTQNTYLFVIRAFDDFCPAAGQTIATFSITVLEEERVENPEIYCADVQADGSVELGWQQTADPDSSFRSWMIYRATNRNGPYTLIDSIFDYNQTDYTDSNTNANTQSIHYIVRARSACHNNWLYASNDTISTMFIDPTFNNQCVEVSWNELDNPLPDGSGNTYSIYREYPIGSGFSLYKTDSLRAFCDTFNICSDSVTYRIEISNTGNGCSGSSSNIKGIRFQYPLPTAEAGDTFEICTGQSVQIGGMPTGPSGAIFSWLPADSINDQTASNPTVNPMVSTDYILSLTDTNNCVVMDTARVNVRPSPQSNAGNTDTICSQNLPYTLAGSVTETNSGRWIGGNGTFNPDRNTLNASYLPDNSEITNGSVTLFLVSTNNGICDADTNQLNILIPSFAASFNLNTYDVSCNGLSDGSASIDINGGSPPFNFQWNTNSGVQSGDTISGLAAGNYDLTITNDFGCDSILIFTINEPSLLQSSISSSSNISCNGLSDGRAVVTPAGGTAPYSYLWNNNQTTDTATNLVAGTYTVTITDSQNCTATSNISLSEPNTLSSAIASNVQVSCNGFNDGQASISVNGGTAPYAYLWSDNQTNDTAFNLVAGTYSVTITDANNCTDSSSVTIIEPDPLTASLSASDVLCQGTNSGRAWVTATGGTSPYSYLWSDSQTSDTASSLSEGTYVVTVTDQNNCVFIDSISVNEPPLLVSSISLSIQVSCHGLSDGLAIVSTTGGIAPYHIRWSDNQTNDTAINLAAGTYYVTITDTNNCTDSSSVTITEPPLLTVQINDSSNISCNGLSDGQAIATVNGGTQPYTYLWSDNQTGDTATNLTAGSYTVTISDANFCNTLASVSLSEPNTLSSSIATSNNVSCNGFNDGQASISVTGGTAPYTYLWSDNQTNDTAFSLVAGTYSVTITDANNCTDSSSVTITEPDPLTASLSASDVLCQGTNSGRAWVTATGGTSPYSYLWSDSQTLDTASSLSEGTYVVTVTDQNNCIFIDSISVNEPPLLISAISSSTNVSCIGLSDGQAVVSTSGGMAPYSILWSDNQTTDTARSLTAGTYFVTITDANNCSDSSSITITEPPLLTVQINDSSNISCNGLSDGQAIATVNGGTQPYAYSWSNSQTSDTATNLTAGSYTVTITDDNSCSVIDSISLSEPNTLASSFVNVTAVSCFGFDDGTAEISVNGGTFPYSYNWSNNDSTNTIDSLEPGSYRVTITDVNNCILIEQLTITEPNPLNSNLSGIPISCYDFDDGIIKSTTNGGTPPYQYDWSTNHTIDSIINLSPGNYTLITIDSNNCSDTNSYTIEEPDPISLTITADDTICINTSTTISVTADGGTGSYSYTWDNDFGNDSNLTVSPTERTTYQVSVTDINNCPEQTESTTLDVRDLFNNRLELNSDGNICRGDSSELSYTFDGNYPPYTFVWGLGLPNENPQYVSPNNSTTYTLSVFDVCNNSISDTVLVEVSDPPPINLNDSTIEGCENLAVNFNNNTPEDYQYTWDFGDGNTSNDPSPNHLYTEPGTYRLSFRLSTPEGCESEFGGNYWITVRPTPVSTISANPTIADIENATISFSSTYFDATDWLWNFGNGDSSNLEEPSITYQDTGSYRVRLIKTNEFNCADTAFQIIQINPNYNIKIPNAFTPSTGGSTGGRYSNPEDNTVFHPFVEYAEQYHLMIFNRWGELIFESRDVNIGWDGYYRGKLSQSDVYVYKLNVTFINGEEATKVGDITLLR